MKPSTQLNRNGLSLLEVLITASLLGVVMLGVMKMSKIMGKTQLQASSSFQMALTSRLFVMTIQNRTAWNKTLNDPANLGTSAASFSCVVNATDCAGKGGPFQADDATGNPINGYQSALATSGFDSSGAVCTTFSAPPAAGNDACPYHLALKWAPICPTGGVPCVNPTIKIQGVWTYNPGSVQRTIAFNATNYNFQLVQGAIAPTTYVLATAAGGQSIAYGTYVPTLFAQVTQDNLNEFDGTYFTPKEAGVYLISYNVSFMTGPTPHSWNQGGCYSAMIIEDSAGTALGAYGANASYPTDNQTDLCSAAASHSLYLNVGNRVYIQTSQTSGAGGTHLPESTMGGGYTTLSVSRLQ